MYTVTTSFKCMLQNGKDYILKVGSEISFLDKRNIVKSTTDNTPFLVCLLKTKKGRAIAILPGNPSKFVEKL